MSQEQLDGRLTAVLDAVACGRPLSVEEAEWTFDRFMDGSLSEVHMAGLLVGLRAKGLAASEIAGGVRALRKAMVPVKAREPDRIVDTCGMGGGTVTTFNISTAAALVVAGAGVPVAKHGNRSFTSRCGSADVLEALGVRIDLTPERMEEVLHEAGIVFMFAPLLHPAMRHVGPVRKALKITTIMNVLGPLTNPAGARRQVVGVADPALLDLVAGALRELGHERALVVHGEDGMDEVSPLGRTRVAELAGGEIRQYVIEPAELGLEPAGPDGLAGGDPERNAAIIRDVLAGAKGAPRDAVVANAAAALLVAGAVASWEEGVRLARASIDDGSAADRLERLREATNRG
ncbi:MAG TPA: anthranilate phosphoribosyltransferase [Longimicrobiales bacterium]|nr:anthranilate phosphoribosyltransferase [Longimicrobiales bacterium]